MKTMKFILTALILCSFQSIIAQDGKEMIGQIYEYESIEDYDSDDNDENVMAVVEYKGKKGYVDESKKVIIPIIYDEFNGISGNLIAARKGRKWGFLDLKGNVVIEFLYDDVYIGFDGCGLVKANEAPVQFKRKWGVINKKGKEIVKFKYVDIWDIPTAKTRR